MNGCALSTITRKYDLRTDHRRLPAGCVLLRSRGRPAGPVFAEGAIYSPGVGEGRRIFDVRPCGEQMLHFRQLTQERQTFWQPGSSTAPGCLLVVKRGNGREFYDILARACEERIPVLLLFGYAGVGCGVSGANVVQGGNKKSQLIDCQLRFSSLVPRTRLELARTQLFTTPSK